MKVQVDQFSVVVIFISKFTFHFDWRDYNKFTVVAFSYQTFLTHISSSGC